MSELAPGPASGYIYQFELALAMLAGLNSLTDTLSLEKIDDVAVEDENDLVTMTVQSKHSISSNGTTFEDTSKALWRTIEIWIDKIKKKELGVHSDFFCATNKQIPDKALIRKIQTEETSNLKTIIQNLLDDQKAKLVEFQKTDKTKGASIVQTIKWINNALDNWSDFEIIKDKLVIWDDNSPKEIFLNKVHMGGSDHDTVAKDNLYNAMVGWMVTHCRGKWKHGNHATFQKSDFDSRFKVVSSLPSLVQAVFRKKSDLGTISQLAIESRRKDLFVRQIEDIKRRTDAKASKIEQAIINFLCHDIEVSHIILKGNITKPEFDEFKGKCLLRWRECFDHHVRKEIDQYDEEEKNTLALDIYDEIMDKIEVRFLEDIGFNTDNRYIHNGTFLQLSNVPEIGWHPEWRIKYSK